MIVAVILLAVITVAVIVTSVVIYGRLKKKLEETRSQLANVRGSEEYNALREQVKELQALRDNLDAQVQLNRNYLEQVTVTKAVADLQIKSANTQFEDLQGKIEGATQQLSAIEKVCEGRKEGIEKEVQEFREEKLKAVQAELDAWVAQTKVKQLNEVQIELGALRTTLERLAEERQVAETELKEVKGNVEKLKEEEERLSVSHAAALQKSALATTGGRSIRMSDDDTRDVRMLLATCRGMKCENAVLKATYDVYVKPEIERIVREAGVSKVSGIYRIWRVVDGHDVSYVGQAVDVGERWKTHAKRAWGVDDVGRIVLYKEMMETGIKHWYWELLEAYQPGVASDDAVAGVSGSGAGAEDVSTFLSEREKYWGGFFGVKELGLNKKLG